MASVPPSFLSQIELPAEPASLAALAISMRLLSEPMPPLAAISSTWPVVSISVPVPLAVLVVMASPAASWMVPPEPELTVAPLISIFEVVLEPVAES